MQAQVYRVLEGQLRADPRWTVAVEVVRARIAEVFARLSDDDESATRQLIGLGGRTAICLLAIADTEGFEVGGWLYSLHSHAELEREAPDLWNQAVRARLERKRAA